MDKAKIPSSLVRISMALTIDVVTLLLIFPIWVLTDYNVFPYAITSIGISLIFLNYVLIGSEYIIKSYSLPTFYSITSVSLIYYLLTVLFTWISHEEITAPWYIVVSVILIGFYVAIVSGLRIGGAKHEEAISSQNIQTYQKINLSLSFIDIKDMILKLKAINSNHDQLIRAFEHTKERFEASTPFGRGNKPHIIEMEEVIALKIGEVKNRLQVLSQSEDVSAESSIIATELESIRQMIINREKVFVN